MVMQLEEAGDTVTDLIFLDGCPTWDQPGNPDIPKMMTVSLAESKQLFDKLSETEREVCYSYNRFRQKRCNFHLFLVSSTEIQGSCDG